MKEFLRLLWLMIRHTDQFIAEVNQATAEMEQGIWKIVAAGAIKPCPLCGGTGDGPVVPAVTVGEPQPAEYPPCDECGGKGYVVVDESETEKEERDCTNEKASLSAGTPKDTAASSF